MNLKLPRGGKTLSGSSSNDQEMSRIKTPNEFAGTHDLSHSVKTTARCGIIYPMSYLHVNPNDRLKLACSSFIQMQPINKPMMDNLEATEHAFYVPFKEIEPNFEYWLVGGKDGNYKCPRLAFGMQDLIRLTRDFFDQNLPEVVRPSKFISNLRRDDICGDGSMVDYFNMRCISTSGMDPATHLWNLSATPCLMAPFIAYQRIYNDFYRVPEIEVDRFLDIPMTSYDVVFNMHEGYIRDWKSSSTKPYAITVGSSDWYSMVKYFYRELKSNDGYIWRTIQFFANYVRASVNQPSSFETFLTIDPTSGVTTEIPVNVYMGSLKYIDSSYMLATDNASWDWSNLSSAQRGVVMQHRALLAALEICLIEFQRPVLKRDMWNTALPYTQRGVIRSIQQNIVMNGSVSSATGVVATSLHNFIGNTMDENPSGFYDVRVGNRSLTTSITMEDIRELSSMTRFLEKSAKIGYRFDEFMRGMFGIRSSEYHDDKPKYLGGTKSTPNIHKVLSTAPDENGKVGQFNANGDCFMKSDVFYCHPLYHGIILYLWNVRRTPLRAHFLDRNHLKINDRFALFFKDFAHLQETAVFSLEANAYGSPSSLLKVLNAGETIPSGTPLLGNQPRYFEYRSHPNQVHGLLSNPYSDYSCYTTAFLDPSVLYNNDEFNHDNPDDTLYNGRLFQVNQNVEDSLIVDNGYYAECKSELPEYANPEL